jgi:hypothetical protein
MTNYVLNPRRPFVLFSMGLKDYEGEYELWTVPDEEITVYHILVRIKHEMELLRKRTGRDFYLFGTHKHFVGPKTKLVEHCGKGPIDILFTVNLSDLARLEGIDVPSPKNVQCSPRRWRTMVTVDTDQAEPIPKEIHLWGQSTRRAYYGLSIASFRYFTPDEKRYLSGKNLFYYLHDSPVKSWCRFVMGTLCVHPTGNRKAVQDRRILATAKLVYPYVYEVKKR